MFPCVYGACPVTWFQAVKAAGNSLAGLHQRMEWEDIIAAGQPDFSKINDPVADAYLCQ